MSRSKIICPVSQEEFVLIVTSSYSYMEVARSINMTIDGHYVQRLKSWISKASIDTSHFTGQLWSKGKTRFSDPRIASKYSLRELGPGKPIETKHLRKIMIYGLGILYQCNVCSLEKWQNKPIVLQIDHIDGDYSNSSPQNLRFLCPNCHSQTSTYGRGKIESSNKRLISNETLVEALRNSESIRQALIKVGLTPKGANYQRCYELAMKECIEL